MREISGVPIDQVKKVGFSDADIDYILEQTEKYRQKWRAETPMIRGTPHHLVEQIAEIATNSFQTGLVVGISKARNLVNAAKKFGFAP
jgi:hypothetical protein